MKIAKKFGLTIQATVDGLTAEIACDPEQDVYRVNIEGVFRGVIGRCETCDPGHYYTQHEGIGENTEFEASDDLADVITDFLLVYVTEPDLLTYAPR